MFVTFFLLFELIQCLSADVNTYIQSYNGVKPKLSVDTAWLSINSTVNFDILLYSLNHECWKCPFVFTHEFPGQTTKTVLVNTTFKTTLELRRRLVTKHEEYFCKIDQHFKERGDYWLFINYSTYTDEACDLVLSNEPMNSKMPILYVAIGLLVLAVITECVQRIYRKIKKSQSADITMPGSRSKRDLHVTKLRHVNKDVESADVPPPYEEESPKPKRQRLRSLDTFRGISLVVMMFVNYGGGGYWFFDHPPWNGLTVADLVFPWFVFIMGTAMNFSFRGMMRKGKSKFKMLLKILRRSVILFGFGIILNTNWGPVDLQNIRIPGVLQRFSLTYLVTAIMELMFARKEDSHKNRVWAPIRDVLLYLHEWLLALGILAAYLALTLALPVPGCPTGYLGPGGMSEGGDHYNCTGGAAAYIDRQVLGDKHIYNNPTPKKIYQTLTPHDPEGILGTLTSIFLCFLGIQAGRIIITYEGHLSRIVRWLIWATITGVVGAVLCKGSQNDGWIPLNKNLWITPYIKLKKFMPKQMESLMTWIPMLAMLLVGSPTSEMLKGRNQTKSVSFILVTACFGFILLSGLYIVMDVFNLWHGAPFVYPGMNSIVVYCCHDVFYRFFPIGWTMDHPQHWELLLKAVWDTAVWVALAYIMFRKKVFVAL